MNEETVFHLAREKPAAERAAFLEKVCAGDPAVRKRVEFLLETDDKIGSFMQSPPAGLRPQATLDQPVGHFRDGPGTVIGPYKLLQEIGEGGMGTVFMAEQSHPVQRKVALKIIKAGMDSRQVIARFEAERQALALMDHPNIARVLDAGTTQTGRPFFAMELVKGVPITEYCDQHHLTPLERLELFVPICQAVQHAHQKGIIHRDLKPSNVLVALYDGKPVPKVIDFGVAKATGAKLTERTLFTEFGSLVGTVEYMSPEQAGLNQLDIDTRSDIYSLGVLLYELLTGTTPLEHRRVKTAALLEMLRMVREEEAPRPSTRLSSTEQLPSISANRGLEPRKLSGLMKGELDWIVMKALEKDRGRRYETASGLAADVRRYLDDDAVLACPPSAVYRFRKFARRNKRALITATLLGVMLLGALGVVGGSVGWVLRDKQTRLVKTANEAQQFLKRADALYEENKLPEALAEVQKAHGLVEAGGGDEELKRQVRQWRADIESAIRLEELRLEWNDHLDVERMYADYARTFREYGIDVEALSRDDAVARIAASRIKLDLVLGLRGWCSAEPLHAARWKAQREIAQAADPDSWRLRLLAAAEAKDSHALRELAEAADPGRVRTRSLAFLGTSLSSAGDPEGAVAFLRKAQLRYPGDFSINASLAYCLARVKTPNWEEIAGFRRSTVALRPRSAGAHGYLGTALYETGRLDEAIAENREALRLKPDYAWARAWLGFFLSEKGLADQAIVEYREALRVKPEFSWAHYRLGNALCDKGLLDQAIAEFREATRLQPGYAAAHSDLGDVLRETGRPEEAASAFGAAVAAAQESIRLKPDDSTAHVNLGRALHQKEEYDAAIAAYRDAIRLKPDSYSFANLGLTLDAKGDRDAAITALREAIRLKPESYLNHFNLGNALARNGQHDQAIAEYQESLRLKPTSHLTYNNLSVALRNTGRLDEAVAAAREAIRLMPSAHAFHCTLGYALKRKDLLDDAIIAFREALRLRPEHMEARSAIGSTLRLKGLLDESIAELREVIQLKPDFAEAHYVLGNSLLEQGLWNEAVFEFREAIRLDPSSHVPHNALGNALKKMWMLDEAIAAYRECLRLKPDYPNALNGLGNALKEQGLVNEAIFEFRERVRLTPNDYIPRNNLGTALEEAGLLSEAVAEYREALRLKPDYALSHTNLVNALLRMGLPDQAIAELRKAVVRNLKDPAGHEALGDQLARQGMVDDAITSFHKAIELKPDYHGALNALGSALCDQKRDYDAAVHAFREAIKHTPKSAIYHTNLGIALEGKKQWDQAIWCYRKAIALSPRYSSARLRLAGLLNARGKVDEAIAAYREALVVDPKDGQFAYHLALLLQAQGRPEEAVACHRGVLLAQRKAWGDEHAETAWTKHLLACTLRPLDGNVGPSGKHGAEIERLYREALATTQKQLGDGSWYTHDIAWRLGQFLCVPGHYERAEAVFRAGYERLQSQPAAKPEWSAQLVSELEGLYRAWGKPEQATEWGRKRLAGMEATVNRNLLSLRERANDLALQTSTASLLFQLHRYGEAEVAYRKASALNPMDPWLHQALGDSCAAQQKLSEAAAAFREAIRLEPNEGGRHHNLADVLLRQRKPADAATEYSEAIRHRPKEHASHYGLGSAYAIGGQREKAAAAYQGAVKLRPADLPSLFKWAALCCYLEDKENYQSACRALLEYFGQTDNIQIADCAAKACALSAGFGADAVQVAKLMELAPAEKDPARVWYHTTKALVEHRAGRFGAAAEIIIRTVPSTKGTHRDALAFSILAMAQQRLDKVEEARTALASAQRIIATKMPKIEKGEQFGDDWHDWLHAQILCREAEKQLAEAKAPAR